MGLLLRIICSPFFRTEHMISAHVTTSRIRIQLQRADYLQSPSSVSPRCIGTPWKLDMWRGLDLQFQESRDQASFDITGGNQSFRYLALPGETRFRIRCFHVFLSTSMDVEPGMTWVNTQDDNNARARQWILFWSFHSNFDTSPHVQNDY